MKKLLLVITVFLIFCFSSLEAQDWVQWGQDILADELSEQHGRSVSLNSDGTVMAIGVPMSTEEGLSAGAVLVYELVGNIWKPKGDKLVGTARANRFGLSVSLSSDGNTLAIAAPHSSESKVQVYKWNNVAWVQQGMDILGNPASEKVGLVVSLSEDGKILALGNPNKNSGSGQVRVFEWTGNSWVQRGSNISGAASSYLGNSVDLNWNGTILAVGADESGAGFARVYEWVGNEWLQKGEDLLGDFDRDHFGEEVVLSYKGDILAVSAYASDANGQYSGSVKVFRWRSNQWDQMGNDLVGESKGDYFGSSLDLTKDGQILVVGSPLSDENGESKGIVTIHSWVANQWIKKGKINGRNEGEIFGSSVSISSSGNILIASGPNSNLVADNFGVVRSFHELNSSAGGQVFTADRNCDSLVSLRGTISELFVLSYDENNKRVSFVRVDESGEYRLPIDTNELRVSPLIPERLSSLYYDVCSPEVGSHNVNLKIDKDTTGLDFGIKTEECALLTLDISSNRRRRCFRNKTFIEYCNVGNADSENPAFVYLVLPKYVNFISADHSYSIDTAGNYIFNVDFLAQGECGVIEIIDSVSCINNIDQVVQCTKAWITPNNDCYDDLIDTSDVYDGSEIVLDGKCLSAGEQLWVFVKNVGNNMEDSTELRVFSDGELGFTKNIKLSAGQAMNLFIDVDGTSNRVEVDQRPGFPGQLITSITFNDCTKESSSARFVNLQPEADEDVQVEISCLLITGSYDPNDKQVSPIGLTENNYVDPNALLEYQIRFQNTGSDTAFKVVIVDTLSEHFDLASLQTGVSSHPYTWSISGVGHTVLTFTFDPIELPDSTTDNLGSQGFVKFKIRANKGVEENTVIENYADIFFDFNPPVRTNSPTIILNDTVLIRDEPINVIIESVITAVDYREWTKDISIYPNPTDNNLYIESKEVIDKLQLFNVSGQLILEQSNTQQINLNQFDKGIYLLKLFNVEGDFVSRKVFKF